MSDDERRQRAEIRRRVAVLRKAKVDQAERDLNPIEGEAAVSLVAALTRESWSASRKPLPEYTRSQIPIRFVAARSA
jgi:hypothetical protein